MHTPITKPLHFDRAVKIVKKARAQVRTANKFWCIAEEANAPLHKENHRLRELVASLERSLRIISEERDKAVRKLEVISAVTAPIISEEQDAG